MGLQIGKRLYRKKGFFFKLNVPLSIHTPKLTQTYRSVQKMPGRIEFVLKKILTLKTIFHNLPQI
jgi:hypothetical protein